METPQTLAGHLTERIMLNIQEHLQPTINFGANGHVHHYNRVYEKVLAILQEELPHA